MIEGTKFQQEYSNFMNNDDNNSYIFKLEKFEGPLDLLLFLIQKNKIDIYDIPIHEITEQYLNYISLMKRIDVNVTSEFIVMAVNLIYIKSKMLLPYETDIEEEYFDDPRKELVEQLLEYQKFKKAAEELEQMHINRGNIFFRVKEQITFDFHDKDNWVDINLFDLINIFNKLLKETEIKDFDYIVPENITVGMKIEEIRLKLDEREEFDFLELIDDVFNVLELVVTFLAILEMVKIKEIVVKQHKLFGDIKIFKWVGDTKNA